MEYILKGQNGNYKIDTESLSDLNLLNLNGNGFHLINHSKSYSVQLLSIDRQTKTIALELDGKSYAFKIEDKLDQLINSLGFDNKTDDGVREIKAPMPGLILDILVKEGEDIEEGSPLFILEAMKMENVIKAATKGKIKTISKAKGDKAEKNELIIELE